MHFAKHGWSDDDCGVWRQIVKHQQFIAIQRLDRAVGTYRKFELVAVQEAELHVRLAFQDWKSVVFVAGENAESPRLAFQDWDQMVLLAGNKAESFAGRPVRQVKLIVNVKL